MSERADESADQGALVCLALRETLQRLAQVLAGVTDGDYAAVPAGVPGLTAGIGGHVRHCLDHVEALLAGAQSGLVAYDRRERGTPVESRRLVAVERIGEQRRRLGELTVAGLAEEVEVETTVAADRPPVRVRSTVGREVAFVLSHTVHHHAVIGLLAARLGYVLPADFVYAPATLAWMSRDACAPSR